MLGSVQNKYVFLSLLQKLRLLWLLQSAILWFRYNFNELISPRTAIVRIAPNLTLHCEPYTRLVVWLCGVHRTAGSRDTQRTYIQWFLPFCREIYIIPVIFSFIQGRGSQLNKLWDTIKTISLLWQTAVKMSQTIVQIEDTCWIVLLTAGILSCDVSLFKNAHFLFFLISWCDYFYGFVFHSFSSCVCFWIF